MWRLCGKPACIRTLVEEYGCYVFRPSIFEQIAELLAHIFSAYEHFLTSVFIANTMLPSYSSLPQNEYQTCIPSSPRPFRGVQHAISSPRQRTVVRSGSSDRVYVLGGGVGGLSAAAFLSQRGVKTTILERGETLGGRLQTVTTPLGFRFDTG